MSRIHWGVDEEDEIVGYGEAGDRWPVLYGDLWRVGDHLFLCGDLEDDAAFKLVDFLGDAPAMAYTDPPFSSSQQGGFVAKTGVDRVIAFEEFCLALASSHSMVVGDVYIEMGVSTVDDLKLALSSTGATVLDEFNITYGHTSPAKLVRATFGASTHIPSGVLPMSGLDDVVIPRAAIAASSSQGDFVLDCCLGRGLTAEAAEVLGRRCIGVELDPRRVAIALDRLEKMGAGTPYCVGNIGSGDAGDVANN